MTTLVLGLGNPIVTDDAAGLIVARWLEARLGHRPDVEVDEDYHGGLRLMERLVGCERAIIIDAIGTGAQPPGSIMRLGPNDVPTRHTASSHDVNLPTALALGRRMGLALPPDEAIVVYGIEGEDLTNFGEGCTPLVSAALPRAVEAVLAELGEPANP